MSLICLICKIFRQQKEPLPLREPVGPDVEQARKVQPRYLRIIVEPIGDGEPKAKTARVNIRIPMVLIRAGVKLGAFIPPDKANQVNGALRSKGLDLDVHDVKAEDLDRLVDAMADLELETESGKEKVSIYFE